MKEFGPQGVTKLVRVHILSIIGKLMRVSFKVGELPYGARRTTEPGDSL